jgi:hypothetical protein
MHAARFAALLVTPPPPPSCEVESPPLLPALESPPSPVLPHQVVFTDAENVNRIHWRPFPAVVHPLRPPPQLYANQGDDDPDHPDRQTCNLAGSVGHYRCSPRHPCRRPSAGTKTMTAGSSETTPPPPTPPQLPRSGNNATGMIC